MGAGGVSPDAWRSCDHESVDAWRSTLSADAILVLARVADRLPLNPERWADDVSMAREAAAVEVLAPLAERLWDGPGFFWVRGLPADDADQLRRLFWVLGNNLGDPVMQNARGEILSEVTDRFAGAERGPDTRGYESNDELRFHCDGGDSIGLCCVRTAACGGDNGLVSLRAIYDEIRAHHQEHLSLLQRGFALYARREASSSGSAGGVVNERRIPVFAAAPDGFSAWLNIRLAELAAEMSGASFSTEEQAALDCVEAIAERSDMKLSFRTEPGDIVWVNNLAVMHRRDRYSDHPDPAKARRLYRMWLNQRGDHPVIPEHAALRAGIRGPVATIGVG